MNSLLNSTNNASEVLQRIYSEIIIKNQTSKILEDEYVKKHFDDFNKYSNQLNTLTPLFELREFYLNNIIKLPDKVCGSNEDKIKLVEDEIPFIYGRTIFLQGYLATKWSIYDTLTEIIGKLVFTDAIAANPKIFPRLPENIILTKDAKGVIGARMHKIMKNSYSYPILLSYSLRNIHVHDNPLGYENIFSSNAPNKPDCFIINEIIYDGLKDKYPWLDKSFSKRDESDWDSRDITVILQYCETEVDDAMRILLNWAIDSTSSQVKNLFAVAH
jgi:hypothetical protein